MTTASKQAIAIELGELLRAIRKRSGLSGPDLARRLHVSQSKVSRIETGRQVPTLDDVQAIFAVLAPDFSEQQHVLGLVQSINATIGGYQLITTSTGRNIQLDTVAIERRLSRSRQYNPVFIPALLQTRSYMRAQMSSVAHIEYMHNTFDVSGGLAGRIERQQIVHPRNNRQRLEFIVTPEALRRPCLGSAGMKNQIDHLLRVARYPNVSLGVLQHKPIATAFTQGFTILEIDDMDDYVEVDAFFFALRSSHAADIELFTSIYESMRSESLWDDDMIDYLSKLAGHRGSTSRVRSTAGA